MVQAQRQVDDVHRRGDTEVNATKEKPLEGWKQIASAIGKSERTAMNYADLGMPVYKLFGQVQAMRSEIEAWLVTQKRHVRAKRVSRRFVLLRTKAPKGAN